MKLSITLKKCLSDNFPFAGSIADPAGSAGGKMNGLRPPPTAPSVFAGSLRPFAPAPTDGESNKQYRKAQEKSMAARELPAAQTKKTGGVWTKNSGIREMGLDKSRFVRYFISQQQIWILDKYADREKVFSQTLQRVAGRCEAMLSGRMSLALEYFR